MKERSQTAHNFCAIYMVNYHKGKYLVTITSISPWTIPMRPTKKKAKHMDWAKRPIQTHTEFCFCMFCIFWWWVCHFFFLLEIVIFDIENWNCVERERKLEMGFSVGFWVMGLWKFLPFGNCYVKMVFKRKRIRI